MIATIRRSLCLGFVCGSLVALSASPPVIGVAQSRGVFFLNNASVPGTGTILDGASVQTTTTSSDVSLKSGDRVTLASNSAAKVFQDRLVLENGMAELKHVSAYHIETGSLRIGTSGTGALVRVAVDKGNEVKVSAVAGAAEVRNGQGLLVARIFPGTLLQMKAVAATTSKLTGAIESKGGIFFLTDETTKVRVELRGSNLKHLVGQRVQVTGTSASGETPAGDASQVILVTSSAQVTVLGAGSTAAGGVAAGAAVATGIPATTVAIVGGVAAAGTVGGLAAAGTFSSNVGTVSR